MSRALIAALALLAVAPLASGGGQVTVARHDLTSLRSALETMGYEAKALAESTETKINRGGLDIYLVTEVSKSGDYVWISTNLGKESGDDASIHTALLKLNAEFQPAHFYIGKTGNLRFGMPIENRNLANASLRKAIERVVDNLVASKDVWLK